MATPAFGALAATLGRALGGRTLRELDYLQDMEEWADYAVGDLNGTILANFSYELHQTKSPIVKAKDGIVSNFQSLKSFLGFCTSVAFEHPTLGMTHVRNLDWPVRQIRDATIILECKSDAGPFRAVSLPGMVGILSGVAKGRFSITINSKEDGDHWVPNLAGWGSTLLVRWIFENCRSYEEALRVLKKAPAFVPFFVTLCGPKSGQKVVVEVNRNGNNRVYRQPDYPVAVANHYPGEICEDEEWDTQDRQELVEKLAVKCEAKTLAGCFSVVNQYPVMHADTVQSMVLHPRTGTVLLQEL
jgi:hypothetical protein